MSVSQQTATISTHAVRVGKSTLLLLDRPEMLIGTFDKMLEYTMGIYADLFAGFRAGLRRLDILVISGYSFSDKGVNAKHF